MPSPFENFDATAIDLADQSDSEINSADQSDSDGDDWFGKLARPLLSGSDAGLVLHTFTGFLPRTCARYVTKDREARRKPPGYFVVSLLRSEQGGTWLAAFMDDHDPKWWREYRAAARKAEILDRLWHEIEREIAPALR